ncbi:MAG: carboxypeptidase regulatory-like domain-containing protein [Candidatus Poribacteria bacterium]|nr:carboxypeptidase regulatory-like domain-containing protein [Candidatus Poribacteria bacterium]
MRYVIKQLSVFSLFTLIVFSPSLYATGLRELVGHWTFEKGEELNDLTGNFPDIKLMGAKVVDGTLDVDADKWAITVGDYKGPDITDKTLVSWVTMQDLGLRSGSILCLDKISGDHFDSIVYAERQPNQWMPGSSHFRRTDDPKPGFKEVETGIKIMIAISYQKGSETDIKIYRNGEQIGGYKKGPTVTWTKGDTEVMWGKRHGSVNGGSGDLDCLIHESRIYGAALTEHEIKSLEEGSLFTQTLLFLEGPEAVDSPSVGDTFSVSLSIVTGVDLHGFSLNLSFDPAVLRAENIEYGDFLNAGENGLTTNGTPVIDNDVGLVSSTSARRNTNTGINGSGNLTKINFEAVGEGSTQLKIQKEEFVQPTDQPLVFDEIPTLTITVFPVRGQISGTVSSSSGQPIADAKVEAFLNGQQVGTSVQTDYQGKYLIDQIYQAGLTTVNVSVPGALPIPNTEVEVIMGQRTKSVDFQTIPETALQSVTDSQGFIRNWLLLGPIWWEKDSTRLMTNQLSPKAQPDARFPVQETKFREIDPKDGDFGTGLAQNLRWSLHVDQRRRDGWEWGSQRISPNDLYGQDDDNYVVYAQTHVKAEEDMKVTMQLEHHGVVIWLNGELVHLEPESRCCVYNEQEYRNFKSDRRMEEITKLELKKGWNSILIKSSRYDFSCRFARSGSVLGQATPLTNLLVSPQLGATTTSIDRPVGLTRGTFNLELEKGLNMISLPVKPDQPMTSKTLAKELDATLVIRLDPKDKTFVPFVPEHFEGSNFTIEGDMGLIVNVKRSQTSTFTGTVWDNMNAAPIVAVDPQSVWAFGLVLDNAPIDSPLTIKNLRSGQTLQSLTGIPAIAFVDQSQQSVVHPQDWIEIQTENTRWRYRVTGQDLQQAFAVVSLNKQIQIPNQTRLLQNYPNPFNPETWIPFQLSQESRVVVSVFGVKGNLVRRLDLGWMIAGNYLEANRAIYWDGKSETGETVASGTYFYQIAAGDYSEIRQMVILK